MYPPRPEIKIIAISNVYCRLMTFKNKGDQEPGHCHNHDHGTLISKGKLLIEIMDDELKNVLGSKIFEAPTFAFINKNRRHQITALEDDSQAVCIHALRDVNENILSPEFLVEEKQFADAWEDSELISDHLHLYTHIKRGVDTQAITIYPKDRKE